MDWTEYFDRKKIVDQAHTIIDDIIQSIHLQKLSIHTRHKLTIDELMLLYRWPIYFSVNTFIERFIRLLYFKKTNVTEHYPPVHCVSEYYSHVGGSASAYYHDIELNKKLMHNICLVINGNNNGFRTGINGLPKCENENISELSPYKRQYNFKSGIRFLKRITIGFLDFFRRKFLLSEIVFLREKWFNNIYTDNNLFPDMVYSNYKTDSNSRAMIRECCKTVFQNNMHNYIDELDLENRDHLLDLFSSWVDHAIPYSLIEGLGDRFNYYRKKLRGWNVKQIHTAIGHWYNDNFKVFSVLAKRKNAILIAHEHGVNNFVSFFPLQKNIPTFYKGITGIMFMDYYCDWGKDKVNDKWDRVEAKLNTKIINTGSVYLSSMRKWKEKEICQDKIILFYSSGPLRDFMANLEEITPEKNFLQRKKVLNFVYTLLQSYSGLEVLYKPFPGIDSRNDPFLEVFSKELDNGTVRLTNEHPTQLMPEVDIVLFDMISTGFAEAIQIGVPTLVYSNRFDYEIASNEGKRINDELENCGVLFYNEEVGIKSFDGLVNNLNSFQEASKDPIRQFQEAVAYPVSAEEFRSKMKKSLVI